MTTIHTDAEKQERLLVFTKGAPDVLLTRCSQELVGEGTRPLAAERRAQILKVNEELAGEALRTLGVAFRLLPANALEVDEVDERVEHDLVFAGLIGMIDPPRAEARDAMARAKAAGIRPIRYCQLNSGSSNQKRQWQYESSFRRLLGDAGLVATRIFPRDES